MKIASSPNYNTKTQTFGHRVSPRIMESILCTPDRVKSLFEDRLARPGEYKSKMQKVNSFVEKYIKDIQTFFSKRINILQYNAENIDKPFNLGGIIEDIEAFGTPEEKQQLTSILNRLDADTTTDGLKDFTTVEITVDYEKPNNYDLFRFSSGNYSAVGMNLEQGLHTPERHDIFNIDKMIKTVFESCGKTLEEQIQDYKFKYLDKDFAAPLLRKVYDDIVSIIPPNELNERKLNTIKLPEDFIETVKNNTVSSKT